MADQSDPQRRDPSHSMSLCVRMTVNARCSLHYDLPQVYPVYVNSLSSPISSLLQTQVSRSLWCCLIQATHASCRIRFFVPRLPAHPTLFLSFSSCRISSLHVRFYVVYLRCLSPVWTCIAPLVFCPCIRGTHASYIPSFSSLAFFRSGIWPLNHVVKNRACALCTRRS